MLTLSSSVSWDEAIKAFFLHKRATRELRTAKWYRNYLTQLSLWAMAEGIELASFTKRHLDAYLAYRADMGRSATTLHHDALSACAFFEWCKKNDCVDRDPLAEYRVRTAPQTHKPTYTPEQLQTLLEAIPRFYDAQINPTSAKGHSLNNRTFHRDRTYAIELVKIDTACRIGEIFNFKLADFVKTDAGWQLTVRHAKGREPRVLPVSGACAQAVNDWLKTRTRVIARAPLGFEDDRWLFMAENGARGNEGNYLRGLKKIAQYAGVPYANNHMSRRFGLNTMAKDEQGGILFAQAMAGHKDPKTTMIYLKIDGDYLRQRHEQVGVVSKLLHSKRAARKKRLV